MAGRKSPVFLARVERLRRLGATPQYVCGEMHLAEKHNDRLLLKLVRERGFTDIGTATRELKLESILGIGSRASVGTSSFEGLP